jgi:hypothetical protein
MNLCTTCGLDFASVAAFDAHRVGKHAYTLSEGLRMDPPREDGRRCLAVDEMEASGWRVDRRGRWVHPREARRERRLDRGHDGEKPREEGAEQRRWPPSAEAPPDASSNRGSQ